MIPVFDEGIEWATSKTNKFRAKNVLRRLLKTFVSHETLIFI